jgi:hypothetical protein
MTSQPAGGAPLSPFGSNRLVVRRDPAAASSSNLAETPSNPDESRGFARWTLIERAWWVGLVILMLIFSALPISNFVLGLSTKDYGLWYQVGLAVRQGVDIYPRPETGRLFPFMYPPSAAAMLAFVSYLGPFGSLLLLDLANSAAWLACIGLSVWLAVGSGRGGRRHPLTVIVPSLSVIVLIHNIYLLGQPNLLLLALLLGAFACLRLKNQAGAGALVATAAAIKAFPILVLGYLVYRRMWLASATTVAALAGWLLLAPLPFRGLNQVIDDLDVWSQGMVFTYNSYGIAQRPFRSYSYKNQSIMAMAHRVLRDVPADGEAVLSRREKAAQKAFLGDRGLPMIDPSTNLLAFLKPHAGKEGSQRTGDAAESATTAAVNSDRVNSDHPRPRWNEIIRDAEPALRNAWRINIVNLDFRTVTLITALAILAICLFVVAVLPAANRRTAETDALEYALVVLLTTMFSPLSFNYAYVWAFYPTTLALHRVLSEPRSAPRRRLKIAWIGAVLLIPAFAIPFPQMAQAYGNLFVPALLLVLGLGMSLKSLGSAPVPELEPTSTAFRNARRLPAIAPVWHCLFSGFGQQCRPLQARHPSAKECGG